MFNNIGKKIKKLAEILCWIGIIVSVVTTIVLWFIGADFYEPAPFILSGFLVGVIGSLFSWISSFFMYGFGELIDNSQEIKEEIKKKPNFIEPLKGNKHFSSYTAQNLKINTVSANPAVGTCDLCERESVVIHECEISDGFSKMNRKLCQNCILKNGGNLN